MTMTSSQPLSLPEHGLIGSERQFQQQEAVHSRNNRTTNLFVKTVLLEPCRENHTVLKDATSH